MLCPLTYHNQHTVFSGVLMVEISILLSPVTLLWQPPTSSTRVQLPHNTTAVRGGLTSGDRFNSFSKAETLHSAVCKYRSQHTMQDKTIYLVGQ